MEKNTLLQKEVSIGIILLLFTISSYPAMSKPEPIPRTKVQPQDIFLGLQTHINISWDDNLTKELIDLTKPPLIIPLNVSFWVTWGLFGRMINHFYFYKNVYANFWIGFNPWCTPSLAFNQLPLYIPPKKNIHQMSMNQLSIDLDYFTPAFEVIPVKIVVTIDSIIGPFRHFSLIHGTTYNTTVYCMAQYRPQLGFEYPEGDIIETPPLTQVEFPLMIENYGNGKTLVENEVFHSPIGWNISLPSQTILEWGEEKEILLTFTAPSNFSGFDVINLQFTPHYYYNYSLMGHSDYVNIIVMYNPL
jgi:hypothetical protein